jgi:predicted XRE-type DNA-binding protein
MAETTEATMKSKLTLVDEAKIKVLFETGAISQTELAMVFGVSQQRISEIVLKRDGEKKSA